MPTQSLRPTKKRRQSSVFMDPSINGSFTGVQCSGDENNPQSAESHSGVFGDNETLNTWGAFLSSSRQFPPAQSSQGHQKRSPIPRTSRSGASTSTRNPFTPISRSASSSRSTITSRRLASRPAMHIVCAVGENLARETCVASLDTGTPVSVQVTKQGNGQTYAETIAYLEMLRPHEVLLNEGRKNSPLARKILQLYANLECGSSQTVVKFISRSYFDQTKGAELLRRLARTDTFDPTLVEEYILLSSTHALLHYTQQILGASFSRKCLDVCVNSGGKNRMAIDRATLLQLELLVNAKTGKSKDSLVSSIDCTKTTVGTRLLRTSLMAPPCRSDTINARLDLVESFLQDEDFFYAVLGHLKNLPAIDKMLTDIAVVPRIETHKMQTMGGCPVVTARLASKGISAIVCVKSTLSALPALVSVLQDHMLDLGTDGGYQHDGATAFTCRSSLLVGLGGGPESTATPQENYLLLAITQALCQPQLVELRELVTNVLTESTQFSRNANAMRHQECFALKTKENGMMEIIRKAFLANVDDIYRKADEYAENHGMHVSVRYSSSRGYYLSVPADNAADLPNIFIQPIKSGNYINCTSEEVHSLNIRAQDNVQDLLLMTYERIQEVLDDARSKYDALAAVSDAIALLDLCHGFADKVTLSKQPWSRPVLVGDDITGKQTEILIRNGRYGIDVSDPGLCSSEGPREIIPNDSFASDKKRFTVISGINGSGKSTYLKQIAIIVLLAHCGSYVPAEEASIPLRNRLCARMGTSDDQENNISSFMLEMKETAFICSNASDKSLVLLDELGRATSNEDGVSIAWAVSEFLIRKGALTFFVTHYPQLCQLDKLYPAVQNQHLGASISTDRTGDIRYTHKLELGPCTATPDYGVEMAKSCGWLADVVQDAHRIKADLREITQGVTVSRDPSQCGEDGVRTVAYEELLQELFNTTIRVVQNETSIERLRCKLQGLNSAIFQNAEVTLAGIKQYLSNALTQQMLPNDVSKAKDCDTESTGASHQLRSETICFQNGTTPHEYSDDE